MKYLMWALSIITLFGLSATGCMKMGPDYIRPEFDFKVPETYQQFGKQVPVDIEPEDIWWELFGDPQINSLVTDALQYNPDIKKAAAVILELQGRRIQTRAGRFPNIDIGGQATRNQITVDTTVPVVSTGGGLEFQSVSKRVTSNSYGLSVPATFELDLWGRLSRADEAARADLLQAEENRETVIQGIIAEVVSLYLQVESLERQISLNELRIKNFQTGLNLVEKRYAAGLTGALEVRQARRSLSQVKSSQPSLYQALGVNQNRLSVLCGKYPETQPPRRQPEDYYKRLSDIPEGLPSELMLRRPDIRAAEARVVARNAGIGEAKANRFPKISLTGNFGYASGELDQLFESGSELWEMAGGLFMPIFDAGRRKAGQDIAMARYEQSVSDYAKTVLNAFAEVENALVTRKRQNERREQLIQFLHEARATQEMAELRYERGLVDYLTVLDAIQARFLAEEQIVLVDLALLQNRVSLHRALGGGWPDFKQKVNL